MDIELGEPAALAGFDMDRFKPQLVCIEALDEGTEVKDQIIAYLTVHGYERLDKYLEYDGDNWYFRPKE